MFIDKIELNKQIGIGPKSKAELLKEGFFSVHDLLDCYPTKYINYELTPLVEGNCLIKGIVKENAKYNKYRNNLNSLSFKIAVEDKIVDVIIFNRPFFLKKIISDCFVYVEGKYDSQKNNIVASNIFFRLDEGKITPIYSLKVTRISQFIKNILERYQEYINDELPEKLLRKYNLISLYDALCKIHFPQSQSDIVEANRRLKYEEFFRFQLKLQYIRYLNEKADKKPKKWDIIKVKEFINSIPFELTEDQKKAVNDIFLDLKSSHAANRLVQGDVGSGKTIVAAISLYAIALDGYQGALMAPTEILAFQHYQNLVKLFKDFPINISLLTSSIKAKEKKEILTKIKTGAIDIIIGTHALISDDVIYNNLGLVITDEQHRFGVNQRQALRKKGGNPDVVFLTATPIPRSLAIGFFGDLDISSIRALPKGRKRVITKYSETKNLNSILNFIKEEIFNNHQAYIIVPLIMESEKMDLHDVSSVYRYVKDYFNDVEVGYLHGKQEDDEKKTIMNDFIDNKIKILVSTTVIEVGVDNKNATIMLILDAERFGLSQLHQLRGRVGRGENASYCFLVSDNKDVKRLELLEKIDDGFTLSEEDLKLRGPGDFFGNKQSGIPKFKIGDIIKDRSIIETAKNDAHFLVSSGEIKKYKALDNWIKNEIDKSSIFD